ncbi:MAG TPA: hypothetical protein VGK67_18185 [Myxococcales bacterium]|jgi:hypothetical protein
MTRRPAVAVLLAASLLGALALAEGCSSTPQCTKTVCSPTVCADLKTDPQHCGTCGSACAVGQSCVEGVCACPAGSLSCDGVCVSVKSDPKNCGVCGNDCGDQLCLDGQCKCPATGCACASGKVPCGNLCVNLATDPKNCNGCGIDCGGLSCLAGQCGCPAGQSAVNGACSATVFAACFNTGELVALGDDLKAQATKAAIGAGPQSIAYGEGQVLVADTIDNALYSVDPKATPIARAAGADRLSKMVNFVAVKGTKAYAVCSGDNVVQVLDLTKPAPASGVAATRTLDEIPTSAATPPAPQNTNPSFAAFAGDKLYVTLLGTCDATGDAAGNRLLEMDVSTVPGKVTRELVFAAGDYAKDAGAAANSPRPAGLAAVGTKLYVAIGNLLPGCVGSAGPGYLAVVDTAANPMTSKAVLLPDSCRNPGFVLATATRVYVTCLGAYGSAATTQEALVVLDPATDAVLKTTTFARCADPFQTGPAACKTVVPGRMALRGDKLLIADNNAGRLLVTDLEGTVAAGFESGVELCPLKCPNDDPSKSCFQFIGDVAAIH